MIELTSVTPEFGDLLDVGNRVYLIDHALGTIFGGHWAPVTTLLLLSNISCSLSCHPCMCCRDVLWVRRFEKKRWKLTHPFYPKGPLSVNCCICFIVNHVSPKSCHLCLTVLRLHLFSNFVHIKPNLSSNLLFVLTMFKV